MKKIFLVIVFTFFTSQLHAFDFEGFVKSNGDSEFYVHYKKANPGQQTFVFINGLVYKSDRWFLVSQSLAKQGFGVLHYEFEGQNRSYLKSMETHEGKPEWIRKGISLEKSVEDLKGIIDHFQLDKIQLVSLSYGTAIASSFSTTYPELIDNLIFMSPLVISLDRYDPKGKQFRQWLDLLELWGPVGSYWADYYYDLVYKWYYGKQDTTGLNYGKWEKDYFRAVFHQVKAVKDFDLRKIELGKVIGSPKVHLLTASKEEDALLKDQVKMWDIWPDTIKASHIHIQEAWHAIPDTAAQFSFAILYSIAKGEKYLFEGKTFLGKTVGGRLILDPINSEK